MLAGNVISTLAVAAINGKPSFSCSHRPLSATPAPQPTPAEGGDLPRMSEKSFCFSLRQYQVSLTQRFRNWALLKMTAVSRRKSTHVRSGETGVTHRYLPQPATTLFALPIRRDSTSLLSSQLSTRTKVLQTEQSHDVRGPRETLPRMHCTSSLQPQVRRYCCWSSQWPYLRGTPSMQTYVACP